MNFLILENAQTLLAKSILFQVYKSMHKSLTLTIFALKKSVFDKLIKENEVKLYYVICAK